MVRKKGKNKRSAHSAPNKPASPPHPAVKVDEGPFRLLDLPIELVLPIVEMAVTQSSKDSPIKIDNAVKSKKSSDTSPAGEIRYRTGAAPLMQPAITRVCRILRREGLPLFYKHNIFWLRDNEHSLRAARRWIDCLSPGTVGGIEQIFIRVRPGYFFAYECACAVSYVLEQVRNALSRTKTKYAFCVRISPQKIVLERVEGAMAMHLRLRPTECDEDHNNGNRWGDPATWIDQIKYQCVPVGDWAEITASFE